MPGLSLIPRGRAILNPAELLDSANFIKLLELLKKRFDLILLDAPPVLNLPDSCIIGKHVDLSFMVVQMEHTQKADVLNVYSTLRKCNIAVNGFVLTKVHNYMPKYMYNSYYGEDLARVDGVLDGLEDVLPADDNHWVDPGLEQ